ncbi:hypothetical protein V2J09_020532 [Rumex salicifolius]
MARQECYDFGLNLKATELRLALPGSDEPEQPTSRKRSLQEMEDNLSIASVQDDNCIAPPSKAQIVGWPPIQSYRKNTLKTKRAENRVNVSGLYVKVNMDGAPYLRKMDLNACKSYGGLLEALEGMFKVKFGKYLEKEGYGGPDYVPSYEDKDGDWMLVGDVPWEMFVSSCKRLRIIKTSETKGLCL